MSDNCLRIPSLVSVNGYNTSIIVKIVEKEQNNALRIQSNDNGLQIEKYYSNTPLKQYLCKEKAIQAALSMLEVSRDESTFYLCLKFLSTLLIRNQPQIIMHFNKIKGFRLLEDTLIEKEEIGILSEQAIGLLFDIVCNEYNCV